MKIIAYYLPQFHIIPENDFWWGNGYTEWTCIKKSKPLFKNHVQPRIPYNNYYYDLAKPEVQEWQATLAGQYGIYGFCIYHYWFNGRKLLEKPLENFNNNKAITLPFCISWANEDWTNGWVSNNPKTLLKQTYGLNEDWYKHFMYLLPFFQNNRYICIDNSPLFVIYHPESIPYLKEMITYWQRLSKHYLSKTIKFASQHPDFLEQSEDKISLMDYLIEYQPDVASRMLQKKHANNWSVDKFLDKVFCTKYFSDVKFIRPLLKKDYDATWNLIIKSKGISSKSVPGAFVDWDNTPRKGRRGSLYVNVNAESFCKYLSLQVDNATKNYSSDMLFLFAWNEWGEGGYLEPDATNKFQYLEAIKKALRTK